ncbi:MAG TPA: S41 family peptidase [Candidatus Pacearchaeota archaeon]|jgi:carboxyl-terminal processing protease|nr:S41 family peptidase [Candidatus Parcubacteria bacterium]HOU45726.1 S41 family peptidase [Candidatus Pacearchaeota archaeon]HPM08259.1 S41 family peptidase [Candidatus Pacearchaeota archaeon]HQI74421.1 S41 family peptidase [Candidatus Pacearchaeota archaeon]
MENIFKKSLLVLFIAGIGFTFGMQYQKYISPIPKPDIDGVDFSVLWETWNQLESNYLRELDYQKMVRGAAEGMVNSLGDPYTSFFDPKSAQDLEKDITGEFEGVGMEVEKKGENIVVVSPLDGTPAQKSGIKPQDIIAQINGTSTVGMSVDDAVAKIRGPKGTKVQISVLRKNADGNYEKKDLEIIRDKIELPTVKLEIKKQGTEDIAYLKIYQFTSHTLEKVIDSTAQIKKNGTKKIIIDLRNNPGGLLDQTILISGLFLDKEKIIMVEGKGKLNDEQVYKNTQTGFFADKEYKIVVLINEGSASASEIMAAALRENDRATLVGKTSFGKGSVQTPIKLRDGSTLKVTIAEWLTPNKNQINGKGIKPDIEAEITDKDIEQNKDPQLEKALEILK